MYRLSIRIYDVALEACILVPKISREIHEVIFVVDIYNRTVSY